MTPEPQSRGLLSVPRVEYLRIRNYRALKSLELTGLTPLTVLLGPNGSGKSTVFDVFAFLAECFSVGLRKAWDRRGRFKELRTRGVKGPIILELKYRETSRAPLIIYHLEVGERASGPYVRRESVAWTRKPGKAGRPFNFLDFSDGRGMVIAGDSPDATGERIHEVLESSEVLAVNTLGQFARHPRVSALRRFISGWHLSYLTADNTRGVPEAGPQEHLSQTGDNLANVIQYLQERHADRLRHILAVLRQRVPRLQGVDARLLEDGRLLLLFRDAPFRQPLLAKYVSDGTIKMLAYLTVLHDPRPPELVGIEEPENHLHPRLLPELAEECRAATDRTQLMVTTHSPFFVNGLVPEELWVLYRDPRGFTRGKRAAAMRGVRRFMEQGARLGQLWMEGHFEVGDPLVGAPASRPTSG